VVACLKSARFVVDLDEVGTEKGHFHRNLEQKRGAAISEDRDSKSYQVK